MKKVLALITSPLHLMEMVNLMLNDFKGFICDVAIDDFLLNAGTLVQNIQKVQLFNNAFLISSRAENQRTGKYGSIIAKILRNVHFSKKNIQKKLRQKYKELNFDYDTICFYDNWYLNNLIALSQNHLENVIWLDDGFCSYTGTAFFYKNRYSDKIRSVLKVNFLRDSITEQYLFHPELRKFNSDFECKKLKNLDVKNLELKNTLNLIFGIESIPDIKQKYVYLDDPYNECGGKISNNDIMNLFLPYIRKEDVIIKMHPRCNATQYKNEFKILSMKGIPWELIYMNIIDKNPNIHLIGLFSYALVTPFLVFGDDTPIIVMLHLIEESKLDKTTLMSLPAVKEIFNSFPDVFLQPKTLDELKNIINNTLGK